MTPEHFNHSLSITMNSFIQFANSKDNAFSDYIKELTALQKRLENLYAYAYKRKEQDEMHYLQTCLHNMTQLMEIRKKTDDVNEIQPCIHRLIIDAKPPVSLTKKSYNYEAIAGLIVFFAIGALFGWVAGCLVGAVASLLFGPAAFLIIAPLAAVSSGYKLTTYILENGVKPFSLTYNSMSSVSFQIISTFQSDKMHRFFTHKNEAKAIDVSTTPVVENSKMPVSVVSQGGT